jgi:uncharacterized membrane protein YhaH (DUF805 family)
MLKHFLNRYLAPVVAGAWVDFQSDYVKFGVRIVKSDHALMTFGEAILIAVLFVIGTASLIMFSRATERIADRNPKVRVTLFIISLIAAAAFLPSMEVEK